MNFALATSELGVSSLTINLILIISVSILLDYQYFFYLNLVGGNQQSKLYIIEIERLIKFKFTFINRRI